MANYNAGQKLVQYSSMGEKRYPEPGGSPFLETSEGAIEVALGNYQLVQLLGRGSFAEVYLGKHIYLDTYAAIKVLKMQSVFETMDGFVDEARIIAGLEHPHIVRVLEFGIEKQCPFLVMSYAPHGTLRQHYTGGTASPTLILPHVKQVAAALYHAHKCKIVHRDVKPENMLLDIDNNVLLSDFGLAMRARNSYQGISVAAEAGTMFYMAPEQLNGKPCAASDQYALGVVIYEWLCGCLPFDGPGMSIIAQHLQTSPPPLQKHAPALSEAVEAVVLKALEKEPLSRFANVQELAHAFEEACSEGSAVELLSTSLRANSIQSEIITPATPVIVPERPKPYISRRMVIGGLVGIGATLCGVAIGRAIPGEMAALSPGTRHIKSTGGTPPPMASGNSASMPATQRSSMPSSTAHHKGGQNNTTSAVPTTSHRRAQSTPPTSTQPSNPGVAPSVTPSPNTGVSSSTMSPPMQSIALTVQLATDATVVNNDTITVSVTTNIGNIPFQLTIDYSGLRNQRSQPSPELIPGTTDNNGNATVLWGPSLSHGQIGYGTYAQLQVTATDPQGNLISSQPIQVQILR